MSSWFKQFQRKFPNLNSIFVVIAVVLIWRSVWSLFDLFFLPDNPIWSYIGGGIIGVVFLLIDDLKLDELSKH